MKRPKLIALCLGIAVGNSTMLNAHETAISSEPAIFTNTEETYFDADAGREAAPWLSLRFDGAEITIVDAFGMTIPEPDGLEIVDRTKDKVVARINGRETTLREARAVTCWSAIRKADKVDGTDDWLFERDLSLHDQGGRVRLGGGESGAPEAILRVRHVTWPERSSNRPSLVLYVHTTDDPDHAVSYSWADENASRVGLNLRWMQASCTITGTE